MRQFGWMGLDSAIGGVTVDGVAIGRAASDGVAIAGIHPQNGRMTQSMRVRTAQLLLPMMALGLLGGCSSSDERAADGPDGGGDDFCSRLEAASDKASVGDDDDPDDAARAAEELRALASRAPGEVADALETFAGLIDELAALEDPVDTSTDAAPDDSDNSDDASMEDFGRIMELIFDPEVIEAGKVIEDYAVDECGFDPEEAEERFGVGDTPDMTDTTDMDDGFGATDPPGDPEAADSDEIRNSGDISLQDLDDVAAAHPEESWSAKIVSSGISGERSIQLFGRGPEDEYIEREPLTVEESLAACEAMREAFFEDRPELEVSVGNGDEVLVTGSASQACAPV